MSEQRRLRAMWLDLESRRAAHLENAAAYRQEAAQVRASRDNPPDPTRALEHRTQSDERSDQLDDWADLSQREAESTLTEMRGLESSMQSQQRTQNRSER